MSSSSSEPVDAGDRHDFGPLTLARKGDRWQFTLTTPHEMTLELPPDYGEFVVKKLRRVFGADEKTTVEMDLKGLPAISSRQLGLMLALQRALADRCERLRVVGVSDGVRRLLDLTRTVRFFDIA
jgi:ABC-type transporter Mla MlaB component